MKVKLIGTTVITDELFEILENLGLYDEALDGKGDSDILVEYSARKCYHSIDKMFNNPNFVQARLKEGHLSIAEHVSFVFDVSGISVACLGQLVRHGLMSESVQSTRFVDQSGVEFVVPKSIAEHGYSNAYLESCKRAVLLYEEMREHGVTKGDARYCLPIGMETTLVFSGNASMWRNFINQRCDKAAQTEIRELASEILKQLYEESPNLFADLYYKFIDTNKEEVVQ